MMLTPRSSTQSLTVTPSVSHSPRPTATQYSRGGGVCIIHRKTIAVKCHPLHSLHQKLHWQSFECNLLSVKIMRGSTAGADEKFLLAVIYQVPTSVVYNSQPHSIP